MKKMQKNAKKIQKNLRISKKSCNFAPSFKKGRTQTQLETQKITPK